MNRVFIDSGAFIAYLVRADAAHAEVRRLFDRPPARWCTSVHVVAESHAWFLHRLGEDVARTFGTLLEALSGLELLGADEDHAALVWQKLDRLRGTGLTWVDASSLVHVAACGVDTVWGTDHHLAVEGARVLPGSRAG